MKTKPTFLTIILVCFLFGSTFAQDGDLPGDANCDGVVNVLDITSIANYFAGNEPDPFCFENADVNGDGVINVQDIILTLDIFLGEGTVTDIDGNVYQTVIIGNQEWMAENLRVTRDADGNDIIRHCYDNNPNWCDLYGGLYTWYTVMNGESSSSSNPSGVQGICPTGWHVPSDAEWSQLVAYLVGQGYSNEWEDVNGVANALKSCRQVGSPLGGDCNTSTHPRWDSHDTHYGTDVFGYSALPGGYYLNGTFDLFGTHVYYWSATESDDVRAWTHHMNNGGGKLYRHHGHHKSYAFTVRCVRDISEEPTLYNLYIEVHPEGAGTVLGEGEYGDGEIVNVTATANEGWEFVNWTGDTEYLDDTDSAEATVIMPAQNITLTANFYEILPYEPALLHYWHFNTLTGDVVTEVASDYSVTSLSALITYPGTGDGYMDARTHRPADPVSNFNLRLGEEPDQGAVLRARNPANTRELLFEIPSTGYRDLVVTYATTRTANGGQHQRFEFSADGGETWVTVGDDIEVPFIGDPDNDEVVGVYAHVVINLSDFEEVNNNPNLHLRIRSVGQGNDNPTGNQRFDNFSLEGVPVNASTGHVIDIDGNIYPTIVVGQHIWMQQNLKVTHYQNGEPINYPGDDNSSWEENTSGAHAWYNNDISYKDVYGGLYNWHAVNNPNGLCPEGWYVPSDEQWKMLEGYADSQYAYPDPVWDMMGFRGFDAGLNLKSLHGWDDAGGGTNIIGFRGLPGGRRDSDGSYDFIGNSGYWWTSTENEDASAIRRSLYSDSLLSNRFDRNKADGRSVRCIKTIK